MYAEVLDSLTKAVEVYPKLNIVVIYTNLDIKPNVSKVDLLNPKKTNRVKIYLNYVDIKKAFQTKKLHIFANKNQIALFFKKRRFFNGQ
jgi:hypothetical protein